jgi:tRNA-dihydrouridine synthase
MKIGDIEFNNIAFLAPMAGIADMAFRELCVQFRRGVYGYGNGQQQGARYGR